MSDCKHEHTYLTDAGYVKACDSCDDAVSAEGGFIARAFGRIATLEGQVERMQRVVAAAKAVHGNVDWVSGDELMAELGAAVEALEGT